MSLTNEDIRRITEAMRPIIREEIHREVDPRFAELSWGFSNLQKAVDSFLVGLGSYHQEFVVYKAQQDRLKHVLVKKGVVNSQELAI